MLEAESIQRLAQRTRIGVSMLRELREAAGHDIGELDRRAGSPLFRAVPNCILGAVYRIASLDPFSGAFHFPRRAGDGISDHNSPYPELPVPA